MTVGFYGHFSVLQLSRDISFVSEQTSAIHIYTGYEQHEILVFSFFLYIKPGA